MKMKDKSDFESVLQNVQKPGQYIGGEWNQLRKNPEKVRIKVALCFPDLYEIGMSYLGQKILYHLLNSRPSVSAERVFAPWMDMEDELRKHDIPLSSLENRIPLHRFDVVGFSLLYELNYTNILTMLDLGGIPLRSADRNADYPLVIGGGPAAFNPEPLTDFFDVFLIGDGEEAFLEIIDAVEQRNKKIGSRKDLLKKMAFIRGVYVPSLYKPYRSGHSGRLAVEPVSGAPAAVGKRIFLDFKETPFPKEIVVPNIRIIFDRVAVEMARGCPQKCRFCQASSIYSPFREKNPALIIDSILESLDLTGYENASLSALSVSDYSCLEETLNVLMEELVRRNVSLSLPSLRPRGLTPGVVENITKVRKTGFTLVPEAGTERMRRVINKDLNDEDLLEAAQNAFEKGWSLLKLYFMVGLPTETEEDLEGIVMLVERLLDLGRTVTGKKPRINISVSSFIPKPHTPFQWLAMAEESALQNKIRFLKEKFRKFRTVRIKVHSVEASVLEAVFARGDRRLNPVLLEAWKRGSRFDSWDDRFDFSLWRESFENHGLDFREYLSAFEKNSILPWEHILTGIDKAHLVKELEKALRGETTPSCLRQDCAKCQGCSHASARQTARFSSVSAQQSERSQLGKESGSVNRYWIVYEKTGPARYLAHIDMNNLIHRGLRRAGVPVEHTKGFHPKMDIKHVPALPLGMEGREEVFELKSRHVFGEAEFLSCVNSFLPDGLRLLRLFPLNQDCLPLSRSIKALVYSVQTESLEKSLSEGIFSRGHPSFETDPESGKISPLPEGEYRDLIEDIRWSSDDGRLIMSLTYSPQKILRPQDIAEQITGKEISVFHMTREKVVLHS